MPKAKVIPFPGSRTRARGAKEERGLVEVHRGGQAEALVVRGLLESEGIPTLLRSRFLHSLHPFSVGDQGEVVVLVPEREVTRSRRLLARTAPGPSFP